MGHQSTDESAAPHRATVLQKTGKHLGLHVCAVRDPTPYLCPRLSVWIFHAKTLPGHISDWQEAMVPLLALPVLFRSPNPSNCPQEARLGHSSEVLPVLR